MLNILPKMILDPAVSSQTQKKKKEKKYFAYTQVYYTTQAFLSNAVKSGINTVIYEC